MVIYCALFISISLCFSFFKENKRQNDFLKWPVFMAFFLFVSVAGLRSTDVGTDSGLYAIRATQIASFADIVEGTMEPGYAMLCFILPKDAYGLVLFLATSTIFVFCYLFAIVKFPIQAPPRHASISLSVFAFTAFIYPLIFNIQKQAIAMGLVWLAILYAMERKTWAYTMLLGGVAFLFHKTAVICFPIYFLVFFRARLRYWMLAYIAVIIISRINPARLFDAISSFEATEKFGLYLQGTDATGKLLLLFNIISCLSFWLFRYRITIEKDKYNTLLYIYTLGTLLYNVGFFMHISVHALRIALYFTQTIIFLLPIVLSNLSHKKYSSLVRIMVFLFLGVFFFGYVQTQGNMIPYTWNHVFY